MSVFSTNQATQLYVATSAPTAGTSASSSVNAEGKANLVVNAAGDVYLQHFGKGGLTRSDLIAKENILGISYQAAADARRYANVATLPAVSAVTAANHTTDTTYVLDVQISQFAGISDEEIHHIFGSHVVKAGAAVVAADVATALVANFNLNAGKELATLVNATASAGVITLTEVLQTGEYRKGVKAVAPVLFTAAIKIDGEVLLNSSGKEATYSKSATSYLPNGYTIGDLEWFCMGERGDIYRGIKWPYNIETQYMISNPATEYNVIDIHYAYVGANECVQKSEKDLIIVAPSGTSLKNLTTALDAIKTPQKSASVATSADFYTQG